jgi:hypothetical protein
MIPVGPITEAFASKLSMDDIARESGKRTPSPVFWLRIERLRHRLANFHD